MSTLPDDVESIPWAPPTAAGVPAMRAAMARQMRAPQEIANVANVVAGGKGSIVPPGLGPLQAAQWLCESEYQRLCAAELFFVSGEMAQLAVTAGETLPDFRMEPEDVPAPSGFMVFAEPIGSYVSNEITPTRVPIVAASWGQFDAHFFPHGGVWFTFYSPEDMNMMERMAVAQVGRRLRPAERARLRAMRGPLVWDNESALGYGSEGKAAYQPGDSHIGDDNVSAPWSQTLRAAWILMNQPNLAEGKRLHRSRSSVRLDEKEGLSVNPVRLLHLRRAVQTSSIGKEESVSRAYTCRWLVRGHWRQQWYPSREVHRPMWIAPHIKGPENRPLRTTEAVHIWDR